jgi:hypothetical protein
MKSALDLDKLSAQARFCFLAILQTAIFLKEKGLDEEHFMEFCSAAWETLGMNDINQLKSILEGQMQKEVKEAGYEKKE